MDETPSTETRSRMTTLVLCLFLGSIGAHRFYTGHTLPGVAQLLTAGGCGLWWAMDVVALARGTFVDAEGRPLT